MCGNVGLYFEFNSLNDLHQLLLALDMWCVMAKQTVIRGEQAGGLLVVAKNRAGQNAFVTTKVVNIKRENLIDTIKKKSAFKLYMKELLGYKPPKFVKFIGHLRFATSAMPTRLETHPLQWMDPIKVDVWQNTAGQWEKRRQIFGLCITHNGDFETWQPFNRPIKINELRPWLNRTLHTDNNTEGDSPVIAGLMTLLTTKGMLYESIRFAYVRWIPTSIEDPVPSEQQLRQWAAIFERNFKRFRYSLAIRYPDPNTSREHVKQLRDKICQEIFNDGTISQVPVARIRNFVTTAIEAFFNNDLPTAMKIFMSRAVGTFGLAAVSTLEENLVLVAKDQPIYIGFNPTEQQVFFCSEPTAIDRVLDQSENCFRLDLDQRVGEIAVLDPNVLKDPHSLKVYSMG